MQLYLVYILVLGFNTISVGCYVSFGGDCCWQTSCCGWCWMWCMIESVVGDGVKCWGGVVCAVALVSNAAYITTGVV